jgi:glycosyltransferase involved in cell wall biosynthesis
VNDSPARAAAQTDGAPPREPERLPLLSIILPAFNEAAVLEANVAQVVAYLDTLRARFHWEIVIVNDGSSDATADVASRLAARDARIHVVHHVTNFGLGQAFKSGFAASRGDYVITLDVDLSYAPEHIGRLLDKLIATRARMVLASPYMEGGQLSAVPWLRKTLSIWANRFLAWLVRGSFSTLTGMVRAYDGPFIRSLSLRSMAMDIMPESIYKSMILRGRIEQIPAHLDWTAQVAHGVRRRSSMRILRQIIGTLLAGFILRPFMFFVVPGLLVLAIALYANFWMIYHIVEAYRSLDPAIVADRLSGAVAIAYQRSPHAFLVGLLSLMLSIQLISLGILSLQSKNYFEELFYLGSRRRGPTAGADPRTAVDEHDPRDPG